MIAHDMIAQERGDVKPISSANRAREETNMWVQVGKAFYNTDHIISVVRHDDAGVYYIIKFADREETGLNEEQIRPLVEALTKLAAIHHKAEEAGENIR